MFPCPFGLRSFHNIWIRFSTAGHLALKVARSITAEKMIDTLAELAAIPVFRGHSRRQPPGGCCHGDPPTRAAVGSRGAVH